MVRKEVCPNCRGNKWVLVPSREGREKPVRCPHCSGNGYRVKLTSSGR